MAGWSATARLDKDQPSARLTPNPATGNGASLKDFWDETSRRYKSGIIKVTVDSVTLSDADAGPTGGVYYPTGGGATYTSGETLSMSIQPPNYNPNTDNQFWNAGIQVAAGALGYAKAYNSSASHYQNYTPVNYGRPGPGALIGRDGTIQYTAVDLVLSSNAFTDISSKFTVTVAGTITFTEITAYSDIGSVGGGSYTLNLCAGPLASKRFLPNSYYGQWGMVNFPVVNGMSSVAVQVQSIATVYYAGSRNYESPVLEITSPGQGQKIAQWRRPIPMTTQQTDFMVDDWTCVFATNQKEGAGPGLVDGNAVQCGSVDLGISGSTFYNLLNAGIVLPPGSDCSAAAVIKYKIAKAS